MSGLAIDPFSLQVVATLLQVNRFVRIDSLGTLTNISPSGSMPGPNAVAIDQNGDFVVAASFGNTYRVANAGGSPVLIGTPSGILGAATWLSAKIEPFQLTAAGPGGGAVALALGGVPPGTIEGFTVASFDTSLPVGAGPIFGFNPDALSFSLVLGLPDRVAREPRSLVVAGERAELSRRAVRGSSGHRAGRQPDRLHRGRREFGRVSAPDAGGAVDGELRPTAQSAGMPRWCAGRCLHHGRSRRPANPRVARPRGRASGSTPGNRLVGAARPAGRAYDVPAPRRFAARWPVKVSRAYARDGQANGLRTKSTKCDRNYDLPRAARVSERTRANLGDEARTTDRRLSRPRVDCDAFELVTSAAGVARRNANQAGPAKAGGPGCPFLFLLSVPSWLPQCSPCSRSNAACASTRGAASAHRGARGDRDRPPAAR